MNAKRQMVTPLDKEALVLLPGLRYARAMIDLAIQTSRYSAMRPAVEKTAHRTETTKLR
jgi:hypothetical protein